MEQNFIRKIKYRNNFKIILICLLFISILVSCSLDPSTVSAKQSVAQQSARIVDKGEYVSPVGYQRAGVTFLSKPKATLTQKFKAKVTVTPAPKPKATKIITPTPKPKVTTTITPTPTIVPTSNSFITPPPRSKNETIEEYAQKILRIIIQGNMSEVEKVKAVHDYMVLNCEYDLEKYKNDIIPESSFAAEGVLWKGKAVCQGYANTFQLFMELLDINSKVILGTDLKSGVSHSWNIISLEDKWYHVDSTWDDPVPDQAGIVNYDYFLIPDSIMIFDLRWIYDEYPGCGSKDYINYSYQNNIIASIDDYEMEFIKRYNEGQRRITILYPEEETPSMDFLINIDGLRSETVEGNIRRIKIHFNPFPTWRLGEYTVYTVIVD